MIIGDRGSFRSGLHPEYVPITVTWESMIGTYSGICLGKKLNAHCVTSPIPPTVTMLSET